jgi:hypothetical protein
MVDMLLQTLPKVSLMKRWYCIPLFFYRFQTKQKTRREAGERQLNFSDCLRQPERQVQSLWSTLLLSCCHNEDSATHKRVNEGKGTKETNARKNKTASQCCCCCCYSVVSSRFSQTPWGKEKWMMEWSRSQTWQASCRHSDFDCEYCGCRVSFLPLSTCHSLLTPLFSNKNKK